MKKALSFALLCAIWGSTWLVIKVGYGGLSPFNVVALRFLIAGLVSSALVPILRVRWPQGRGEWGLSVLVGVVLFGLDYGLIYWAEQFLESGLTAVLFAVFPLTTAVIAHLWLPNERLTTRKLGGILISIVGVALLFGDKLRLDLSHAWPMLAMVGSAICASFASVATKKYGQNLHPAALDAPAMLIGGGLLAVASLVTGGGFALPHDAGTWTAVLYLAIVGSIVTFLLYFWLLKTWDATTLSFIAVITPALALFLGFVVLQERLTPWVIGGTALILAGVVLASRKAKTPAAKPTAAPEV